MKKALKEIKQEFESDSVRTLQYLSYHRLFKREFTKYLIDLGCMDIEFFKPNHFDITGFFKKGSQWWYFSVGDLRWSKDKMLIRTATSNRDYTGGSNCYVYLFDGEEQFDIDFKKITNE